MTRAGQSRVRFPFHPGGVSRWIAIQVFILGFAIASVGCGGGGGDPGGKAPPRRPAGTKLRIYHDPYRDVDWANDFRVKGQHHDHLMPDLAGRLRAYEAAGYQAVSLMDYSGAPQFSYALKARLWTPEMVVPPDVLSTLKAIKVFIPNGEEVGLSDGHYTSPYLTQYIEYWSGSSASGKQPWHYSSAAELGSIVNANGGLVIAAHAWAPELKYSNLPFLFGVEIYNPVAEFRKRQGEIEFTSVDRNRVLVENWDRALATDFRLVGIAVNDHLGPYRTVGTPDDDIRDSGKVLVFCKSQTLDGYENAFRRRALLAVKDLGIMKDQFPLIRSITQDGGGIRIDTDDSVRWIAHGSTIGSIPELSFAALPLDARYVRAEVRNSDGSTAFTQAFSVRPLGDANGDDVVNSVDSTICDEVAAGRITDPEQVAACGALQR